MSITRNRPAAVVAALLVATTAGTAAIAAPDVGARPYGHGLSSPGNSSPIRVDVAVGGAQPTDPYPSALTTWGIDGPITDVDVELSYVTFGRPADVDILLVSPSGTPVMLASDTCGTTTPVVEAYWTIDDEASTRLGSGPTCGSGSWKPVDLEPGETLPATAPRGPYQSALAAFRGENPNGTWQLFVHDDTPRTGDGVDHGVILQGFRVIITTESRQIVVPGGATGEGPASQYPFTIPVSGQVGRIQDVSVHLHNISHSRPDDLDVLLVAPGGQEIMLVSDSCGHFPTPNTRTWRINDRDPAMADNGNCNLGGAGGAGNNFAPTDHEPGDVLPAPAPPGPYSTSLSRSLFDTDPNGEWKVFVHDDFTGHSGYLRDVQLSFELGPPVVQVPDTLLSARPDAVTRARRATFEFTATETPATFHCRLDADSWTFCAAPRTYRGLGSGRHTFRVRAVTAAGVDASPAKWVWRIRR